MLPKQSMTKNTAFFLISIMVQKAMTLVYFVIVANVFGPSEQGRYSAALAFTTLFGVFVDMGTSAMLTRQAARDGKEIESLVKNMFFSRILLGIAAYGLMVGGAYAAGYSQEMVNLIMVAALSAIIDTCSVVSWAIIRGFHNLTHEALGGVLAIVVMVGAGGVAMYWHAPIIFLVGAVLLGSIANLIFALWVLTHKLHFSLVPSCSLPILRTLFALSLPFAGAAIFSRIYTYVDTALLARFAGEHAAGWYSAANKVILALNLIPSSLSASLYPTLSSYAIHQPDRVSSTFAKTFFLLALIAFPMAAGIILLAPSIVGTFYNEEYLPTIVLLQVLSISMVFIFLYFPLGALLAATNQQYKNTAVYGLAAGISIAGNAFLIPRYGALGSAFAALAVSASIFLISSILTFRHWRPEVRFLCWSLSKIICATACMSIILFFVSRFHLAISVLIGVSIYAVCCYVLRIVTRHDALRLIQSLVSSKQ